MNALGGEAYVWWVRSPRTAVIGGLILGGVLLGLAAAELSTASQTPVAEADLLAPSSRTRVYDLRGKIVFTLTDQLCDAGDELCATDHPSGVIYVSLTHTTCGGAVPVPGKPSTWRAWAGRRLLGTIVKREKRHVDVYSRTGRKTGYAIGPYPVHAAAVHMIWPAGRC